MDGGTTNGRPPFANLIDYVDAYASQSCDDFQ